MERDKLNHADPKEVARNTVAIFDVLQKVPLHIRALALAAALSFFAENEELEPQDIMTVLGNIRAHEERQGNVEFAAVSAYLKEDFHHA